MRMTEQEFADFKKSHPELDLSLKANKKNKYRNEKVFCYEDDFVSFGKNVEGHGKRKATFDSCKEYNRFKELQLLEKAKKISNLDRQKTLLIQEKFTYNGETVQAINYKADFMYVVDGKTIVEDVKPYDKKTKKYKTTKDFALKWKLLKYKYPDYVFVVY